MCMSIDEFLPGDLIVIRSDSFPMPGFPYGKAFIFLHAEVFFPHRKEEATMRWYIHVFDGFDVKMLFVDKRHETIELVASTREMYEI